MTFLIHVFITYLNIAYKIKRSITHLLWFEVELDAMLKTLGLGFKYGDYQAASHKVSRVAEAFAVSEAVKNIQKLICKLSVFSMK